MNDVFLIAEYSCKYYPAPLNGAVACVEWPGGQYCAVQCNIKYNFTRDPEPLYNCAVINGTGTWVSGPSYNGTEIDMPWPDCAGIYDRH